MISWLTWFYFMYVHFVYFKFFWWILFSVWVSKFANSMFAGFTQMTLMWSIHIWFSLFISTSCSELVSEFYKISLKNVFRGNLGDPSILIVVTLIESLRIASFAFLFPNSYNDTNFNFNFIIIFWDFILFLNHKLK